MSTRKRVLLLVVFLAIVGVRFLMGSVIGEPRKFTRWGLLGLALVFVIYAVFGRDANRES